MPFLAPVMRSASRHRLPARDRAWTPTIANGSGNGKLWRILAQGMEAVAAHLDASDPAAAARARERYRCFAAAGMNQQNYAAILSDPSRVDPAVGDALRVARQQRGIGVRYVPRLELAGHYYDAQLSRQFDAFVHIERTTALHPRINR